MAEYKQKTKQYIINSAKQPIYAFRDDCILFNLNACFVKKGNFIKFDANIKEIAAKGGKLVNFCNLASLCAKWEWNYCSDEVLNLVKRAAYTARESGLKVVQRGIKSYGEIDMKPIDNLISYDEDSNVLYTNIVLVDCLNLLGYVDSQIREVAEYTKDFRKVIPPDLIDELPIANRKTKKAYERILDCIGLSSQS